ncbi:MAG: hypothetical protein AB1750_04490 [Chloroflexota bacterium]
MENSIASLRPMRLGEILDQAVRLYRRNFVTFIGIIALIHVPVTLISLGVSYFTQVYMQEAALNYDPANPFAIFGSPGYLASMGGGIFMGFVQLVLVQGVAAAALTRAVADSYLGQPAGILEAYQRIGDSWGRLVMTLLLMMALLMGLAIATVFVPCVGWLIGPGLLIFLSMAVNPLVAPSVVIEKQGVGASLRRAWDLARRRFWWLLGFIFILYLFAQLVVAGPTYVLNWLVLLVLGSEISVNPTILAVVVAGFVSLTFTLLYLPLQLTAHALVYFDLRVRTEGFDLALLSMQTSGAAPDMEAIRNLPVQAPSEKVLEWTDVGNFVILTLALVGLYCLLVSLITIGLLSIGSLLGGF